MKEAEKVDILEKVQGLILLSLSNGVLREVAIKKTTIGLWTRLESKYQKKSLTNRLYQKQRLYTLKMTESMQVKDHIDEFNRIVLDLEGVGVKIEDEDQALILLCSLPNSYENFVDTILYGRETIRVGDVKDALQSKELQRKVSSSTEYRVDSSLVVSRGRSKGRNGRSRYRSRSKPRPKRYECFHCNEVGHFKRNCPKLQNGEESKESARASVVQENTDDVEGNDVLTVCTSSSTDSWIIDTGASYHMTFQKDLFSSFKEWNGSVRLGDDEELSVKGSGTVQLKMYDGTVRTINAWYVPGLRKNLISTGTLDKQGYNFSGGDGQIKISKGALTVMRGKLQHGIYNLIGSSVMGTVAVTRSLDQCDDSTELRHHRLGHMSEKGLGILSKQGLLDGAETGKLKFCETCIIGKQRKVKFSSSKYTYKEMLDYIHSDLWGPSPVKSYGGCSYFVTFIDDYSRKVWVYFLKSKDEVFGKFKEWKTMIEKRTGKHVKTLRTDNGLEFCNRQFDEFCRKEGIVRHRTVRYTP